jgi:hypothetical protein
LCHPPLLSEKQIILLLKERILGETCFPPKSVEAHYLPGLTRFEVKISPNVRKGDAPLGLFLKSDSKPILPDEKKSFGVYGGKHSSGRGVYHYDLTGLGITIDGTPRPEFPFRFLDA